MNLKVKLSKAIWLFTLSVSLYTEFVPSKVYIILGIMALAFVDLG